MGVFLVQDIESKISTSIDRGRGVPFFRRGKGTRGGKEGGEPRFFMPYQVVLPLATHVVHDRA